MNKVFAKHLEMTTNCEDNESAMIIVLHPRAVKEIFLDCTASFDYELHVSVDGRELQNLDPNVYYNGYEVTFYWNDSFDCHVGSRVVITLSFWLLSLISKQQDVFALLAYPVFPSIAEVSAKCILSALGSILCIHPR